MSKKFLTQQEKFYLRSMKNQGRKIPENVKQSIFGKGKYNPNLNLHTGKIEK